MAEILSGAAVSASINEKTAATVQQLAKSGITPTLALLRIGQREDDLAYENSAEKRCQKVGVAVRRVTLPETVTQAELSDEIQRLNCDSSVHGVLVFLPLPSHLSSEAVRRQLAPQKDVDGITYGSLSGVFTGSGEGFSPCTAQACIEMLDYYRVDCTGKSAAVVGRSLVVGKPVAMLLMAKNATVTLCHTRTRELSSVTRNAEILIAAAGKAGAITAEHFSPNQIVIDVGINFANGKLCGDVDFDAASSIVRSITPVPGGVGTVTTSVLVSHVAQAAKMQNNI